MHRAIKDSTWGMGRAIDRSIHHPSSGGERGRRPTTAAAAVTRSWHVAPAAAAGRSGWAQRRSSILLPSLHPPSIPLASIHPSRADGSRHRRHPARPPPQRSASACPSYARPAPSEHTEQGVQRAEQRARPYHLRGFESRIEVGRDTHVFPLHLLFVCPRASVPRFSSSPRALSLLSLFSLSPLSLPSLSLSLSPFSLSLSLSLFFYPLRLCARSRSVVVMAEYLASIFGTEKDKYVPRAPSCALRPSPFALRPHVPLRLSPLFLPSPSLSCSASRFAHTFRPACATRAQFAYEACSTPPRPNSSRLPVHHALTQTLALTPPKPLPSTPLPRVSLG